MAVSLTGRSLNPHPETGTGTRVLSVNLGSDQSSVGAAEQERVGRRIAPNCSKKTE